MSWTSRARAQPVALRPHRRGESRVIARLRGAKTRLIRVTTVREMSEPPWIRSYALTPKRLSEGGWVWLKPYEWRWGRPAARLPSAVNPARMRGRKARPSSADAESRADI